jgi:hypothetical protein
MKANNAHFRPYLVARVRGRSPGLASGLASTGGACGMPAALITPVRASATEQLIAPNT